MRLNSFHVRLQELKTVHQKSRIEKETWLCRTWTLGETLLLVKVTWDLYVIFCNFRWTYTYFKIKR